MQWYFWFILYLTWASSSIGHCEAHTQSGMRRQVMPSSILTPNSLSDRISVIIFAFLSEDNAPATPFKKSLSVVVRVLNIQSRLWPWEVQYLTTQLWNRAAYWIVLECSDKKTLLRWQRTRSCLTDHWAAGQGWRKQEHANLFSIKQRRSSL